MLSAADQQIQVRLKSTEEQYRIDQNVFSVSSSSSITELQDLIKNLLDITDSDIEFNFRIGDELLQSTIRKHCESSNFSGEAILDVDYFEKRKAPDETAIVSLDDWVAGVCVSSTGIYAGLYNGQIASISCGEVQGSYEVHCKPIKSIALVREYVEQGVRKDLIVTSSLDQNLVYSSLSEGTCVPQLTLKGHTETVTCCAVSPSTEQVASGSWDTLLKIWSASLSDQGDISEPRKKKGGPKAAPVRTPVMTLGGHTQAVTGAVWKDDTQIITTSLDMAVKVWDTQLLACSNTLAINSALQCVDWSSPAQLVAAGSSDKYIRLFDLRASSSTIVNSTLIGHDLWVSSVAWSPTSEVELVSGSYDGRSLLWDIRSPKSYLAVVGKHEDKVMCLGWSEGQVVSGGADSKLHIYKI